MQTLMRHAPTTPHRSRRRFLTLSILALTASLCPERILARPHPPVTPAAVRSVQRVPAPVRRPESLEKSLALYNANTGEQLHTVYWFRGKYLPDSLRAINRVLRDHHADAMHPIDPALLDLLHALSKHVDAHRPFHVTSAYRSPATNAWLRQSRPGVADRSLHSEGRAVDLRLPGYDLAIVRRAAIALHGGGVGYYPSANFVHLDTGPVRSW
jgi:uncharacterized protein YcbK (DUF882 family)